MTEDTETDVGGLMPETGELTNRLPVWIGLGALFFVGAAGAYWYFQMRPDPQSPEYALQQLRKAVETRNPLLFDRYVELERFTQAFVDGVFTHATRDALTESAKSTSSGEAIGSLLGVSLTEQYKPVASSLLKSAVRRAIETGRADSVLHTASAGDSLKAETLLNPAGVEPNGFRGITEIQQVDGLATFGLRFFNSALDTTVTFKVQMERQEDGWSITEPYNLTRLLEDIEDRRRAVKEREREKIRELAKKRVENFERAYDDFLDALDAVVAAGEGWRQQPYRRYRAKQDSLVNELYDPFKVEQDDKIREDRDRLARELKRGPTKSDLRPHIAESESVFAGMEWGVAGLDTNLRTVVWVRRSRNGSEPECATVLPLPIEHQAPVPELFNWIRTQSGPTCRGKGVYVPEQAYQRALEHVRESRDWLTTP